MESLLVELLVDLVERSFDSDDGLFDGDLVDGGIESVLVHDVDVMGHQFVVASVRADGAMGEDDEGRARKDVFHRTTLDLTRIVVRLVVEERVGFE